MKAKITAEPTGTITYTTVANHISTAVSELSDYLSHSRKVIGVSGRTTSSSSYNIYNLDGTISTGHHANWIEMGAENCKKVSKEYSRLGFEKVKGKHTCSSSQKNSKNSANKRNTISQLEASNLTQKNIIASLKRAQDPGHFRRWRHWRFWELLWRQRKEVEE